jgi:hypothetical protein
MVRPQAKSKINFHPPILRTRDAFARPPACESFTGGVFEPLISNIFLRSCNSIYPN